MPAEKTITIRANGTIELIHDDNLRGLQQQGTATITRASHVEPGDPSKGQDPLLWYVDFTPIGKDTLLGGYVTRQEALDQEVIWLNIFHL